MRGRQRWVLVLAAVVGIAGGVTTAILAPGSSDPGSGPAEVNDPLRLGIPQVSLPSCTDEAVLVLGVGDSAAALTPTVSDAGDGARYLRTDESCETLWGTEDEVPQYVVYRGPYDSEAEPCRAALNDGASTSPTSVPGTRCSCSARASYLPPSCTASSRQARMPSTRNRRRSAGCTCCRDSISRTSRSPASTTTPR